MDDPFVKKNISDVQQKNYTGVNSSIDNLCKNIKFNDIKNEIHCICLRILLITITLKNVSFYIGTSSNLDPTLKSEFNSAFINTSSSIGKILQRTDVFQLYKLNLTPVITLNGKPVKINDTTLNFNSYFGIIFVKILYDFINANIINIKLNSNGNIDFMDLFKVIFENNLIKINEDNLTKYMKIINYTTYMKN